jgi:hypothetical protein
MGNASGGGMGGGNGMGMMAPGGGRQMTEGMPIEEIANFLRGTGAPATAGGAGGNPNAPGKPSGPDAANPGMMTTGGTGGNPNAPMDQVAGGYGGNPNAPMDAPLAGGLPDGMMSGGGGRQMTEGMPIEEIANFFRGSGGGMGGGGVSQNARMSGSVICTVLRDVGLMDDETWRADQEFGKSLDPLTLAGYHLWAVTVARWMRRSMFLTTLVEPIVSCWALEMCFRVTGTGEGSRLGRLMLWAGLPICHWLGRQSHALRAVQG